MTQMDKSEGDSGDAKTVMVVEDEIELRIMIADSLEYLGYDVVSAASGDAALTMAQAGETIDILLTDVVMPGDVDGFALARDLRDLRGGLPVIYMSGKIADLEPSEAVVPGLFLKKPFAPSVVADAIAKALSAQT